MKPLRRVITGVVLDLIGLGIIVGGFFSSGIIAGIIYGVVFLVLGTYILLNKKEDSIEQIKKIKGGKK